MRSDDEIGVLASRDGDGDWGRQLPSRAPAVDDLTDGADVNGVALERFDEGFLELGSASGVENLQKPSGGAAEIAAALGNEPKECLAAARGLCETVETAMLAGAALFFHEPLYVCLVLNLLSSIPGSNVGRDDVISIGDADGVEVREDDQRALDAVVWNGVIVEVEASVRRLADFDLETIVRRERLVW